ncbi:hypothetical protein Y032_0726g1864 [Ancylostoma ceylanicum]|uniref:Uncharacterized protein n=1 Tax=Ancylostoma ceylanicum TaxID=53326 RepID=A0A016WFB0_9BILA|nr:hypothetical protein Y032_0726g1864 [Ancylostoma ceylanicum]
MCVRPATKPCECAKLPKTPFPSIKFWRTCGRTRGRTTQRVIRNLKMHSLRGPLFTVFVFLVISSPANVEGIFLIFRRDISDLPISSCIDECRRRRSFNFCLTPCIYKCMDMMDAAWKASTFSFRGTRGPLKTM